MMTVEDSLVEIRLNTLIRHYSYVGFSVSLYVNGELNQLEPNSKYVVLCRRKVVFFNFPGRYLIYNHTLSVNSLIHAGSRA